MRDLASPPLLRVSVTTGERRVDLVLPGGVPVAELLPELAVALGVSVAEHGDSGWCLTTLLGEALDAEEGLAAQGIQEGVLLVLAQVADRCAPTVYDDLAEAVVNLARQEQVRVDGRRLAVTLGVGCVLLAASCLVQVGPRDSVCLGLAGLGALLLTMAVIASHRAADGWAIASPGWSAAGCAGLAAALFSPTVGLAGELAGAAAAALAVALFGLASMGPLRMTMLPLAFAALVVLLAGVTLMAVDSRPNLVLMPMVVIVVTGATAFPSIALSVVSLRSPRVAALEAAEWEGSLIDVEHVEAQLGQADEIVAALTIASGLVFLVFSPFAVSAGAFGALVMVDGSLLMLVRTRGQRSGVVEGIFAGLAGLVAVTISVILMHPAWRAGIAIGSVVVGAALLASSLAPPASSAARARLADVMETVLFAALLPLATVGSGLLTQVRG